MMNKLQFWHVLLVGLVLAFVGVEASAQEVKGDSAVQLLPLRNDDVQKGAIRNHIGGGNANPTVTTRELSLPDPASPGRDSLITLDVQRLLHPNLLVLPFSLNPTLLYIGDFHTSGALLSYRTGQIWLEGGVRRSYDAVTGRWETLPVVAPYYNFGSKFRLQIDTGPLIQQLLRGAIYGHEGHGNPTIAPPRNSLNPR